MYRIPIYLFIYTPKVPTYNRYFCIHIIYFISYGTGIDIKVFMPQHRILFHRDFYFYKGLKHEMCLKTHTVQMLINLPSVPLAILGVFRFIFTGD